MKWWQCIILAIIILAFGLIGFLVGKRFGKGGEIPVKSDTTYVVKFVHDTVEVIRWRTKAREDAVRLAAVKDSLTTDAPDTTASQIRTALDSVDVKVPIDQVTCKGKNYIAVIEGFRPRLVSIDILQQTQYIETVKTLPKKHWGFGFSFGGSAGYFYTPKGWQPGTGVGINVGVQYTF